MAPQSNVKPNPQASQFAMPAGVSWVNMRFRRAGNGSSYRGRSRRRLPSAHEELTLKLAASVRVNAEVSSGYN